jgi:hypothetical protein
VVGAAAAISWGRARAQSVITRSGAAATRGSLQATSLHTTKTQDTSTSSGLDPSWFTLLETPHQMPVALLSVPTRPLWDWVGDEPPTVFSY